MQCAEKRKKSVFSTKKNHRHPSLSCIKKTSTQQYVLASFLSVYRATYIVHTYCHYYTTRRQVSAQPSIVASLSCSSICAQCLGFPRPSYYTIEEMIFVSFWGLRAFGRFVFMYLGPRTHVIITKKVLVLMIFLMKPSNYLL